MNRRQKKKQFKKKHGYNPPEYCRQKRTEEKERFATNERAAEVTQVLKQESIKKMADAIRIAFAGAVEEFGKVAENLREAFRNLTDAYKMGGIGEKEAPPVITAKALRERRNKRCQTKRYRVYRR